MKQIIILLLLIFVFALMLTRCNNAPKVSESVPPTYEGNTFSRDDTMVVFHAKNAPRINGEANDKVWLQTPWYPINEVWIPYGEVVESFDFYGRYKVLWSEEENLLYVLAEIRDDVFVGGHKYAEDPVEGRGYADYDILEIFIDEDNVRGRHVFDSNTDDANEWGNNGENAFAYHLTIDTPQEKAVMRELNALDIAGNSWDDYKIANYKDHIPAFAVKKKGDVYTWELALKVYGDSYNPANPENSRISIRENKVMGFSVAYCDNDDLNEDPPKRDHFIGSVKVPVDNYNDHWMDSEYFGTIMLKK